MTNFVNDDKLTAEGQAVIRQLEADIASANNDPQALNELAGMTKHYWANVERLKAMTPEQWIISYPYAAQRVYEQLTDADRNATEAAKEAALSNGIAQALQKMATQLQEFNLRLAALEAGPTEDDETEDDETEDSEAGPTEDGETEGDTEDAEDESAEAVVRPTKKK